MTAIEFSHVSKQYRLGLVSTGTHSHDFNRFWQTKILHREDPAIAPRIAPPSELASLGGYSHLKPEILVVEEWEVAA